MFQSPNNGEEVTITKAELGEDEPVTITEAEPGEDEPSSLDNHGEHNHGECGQDEANDAPTANTPYLKCIVGPPRRPFLCTLHRSLLQSVIRWLCAWRGEVE